MVDSGVPPHDAAEYDGDQKYPCTIARSTLDLYQRSTRVTRFPRSNPLVVPGSPPAVVPPAAASAVLRRHRRTGPVAGSVT
ncbi:hypothetical protein [Streptomyces macrosporus]|uniref:Uncharacterized protein n=1 Tax=Streptomyces macrosporus TaxID=44032 RepID=A0ABP5XBT0_9ACTN